MTDVKHTAGPWAWSEDATSPGYFLVKGGETHVCIMQERDSDMGMDFDPDRGEAIANARLIAAAPDLLEAVKDARAMLQTVEVLDGEDGDPWSNALARMEAAIAKATNPTS
jgi:hypothetical protein